MIKVKVKLKEFEPIYVLCPKTYTKLGVINTRERLAYKVNTHYIAESILSLIRKKGLLELKLLKSSGNRGQYKHRILVLKSYYDKNQGKMQG